MDFREAANKIPILREAGSASLAYLSARAHRKHVRKGAHLYWEGAPARDVYFLLEGAAAPYKISGAQDKRVIFIYGPGALLNEEFLDGRSASVNCELLSDSQILCFERKHFLYACEMDFALAKSVMDAMALKIRRLYRQIKNTSNAVRGDRRIAAKLWKLSRDIGVPCGEGTEIDVALSITYLADLLGLTRETVSRQLKQLCEEGLVIVDKNRFIIPDREALRKYFHRA